MVQLIIASFLWSLSFALIKSSGINADVLSAARLGLAALIFVPVLVRHRRRHERCTALHLGLIGAIQFGLMYVMVMRSYRYLQGHEVALLTVTTPILVVLIEGLMARRLRVRALLAAALAVVAAMALRWPAGDGWMGQDGAIYGLLLVTGANLAWALGQVLYRVRGSSGGPHRAGDLVEFGWLYVGGFAVAGAWALFQVEPTELDLDRSQWLKILYLGLVPSGLAFYLWNRGAAEVSIGTLAVMNNLKVPLAVAVALAPPFNETFSGVRLGVSGALLLLALGVATWRSESHAT